MIKHEDAKVERLSITFTVEELNKTLVNLDSEITELVGEINSVLRQDQTVEEKPSSEEPRGTLESDLFLEINKSYQHSIRIVKRIQHIRDLVDL